MQDAFKNFLVRHIRFSAKRIHAPVKRKPIKPIMLDGAWAFKWTISSAPLWTISAIPDNKQAGRYDVVYFSRKSAKRLAPEFLGMIKAECGS